MSAALSFIVACLCFAPLATVDAADVQATIDFDVEGLPTGTVLTEIQGDAGAGDLVGPIGISGSAPGQPQNRAIIFDSDLRTGGDADLGTPNIDFGGPGIGSGGSAGATWPNDNAQWNVLIVAENLVDANNDGLIDSPDDLGSPGGRLEFDFTTIQSPFSPAAITVHSITTIDAQGGSPGEVRFYDSDGVLIATTSLISGGENALVTQNFGPGGAGIFGAARMVVEANDSLAIDDVVIEVHSAPPPTCDVSAAGPITVVAGEEVCFDVTGAVGMSTDPVCTPGGTCAPLLDLACNESANVHWDLTGCLAFGNNTDFSEFTPTITESCSGVSVAASIVEQIGGMHSCTSDVMTGAGGEAFCVPVRTGSSYNPTNIDKTLRFDVTVTETEGKVATLEEFSFFHSAATSTVQHQTGGSPVPFSNDPPELYALRVLRDGTQVFLLEDVATSSAWIETSYSFANDPQFQVTSGSAQFTFELQGYDASGNSAQLRVWDLDEFDVSICCGEDNSSCPPTVVLSATSVPAGAMGTPMLPADSSPASSVTSNVCWTPGAGDVGTHTFDFLITDCIG